MSKAQVVTPRFEVLRRGEVLQVLPINRNRVVIGSEDGAHLRLKHPAIAPRHLEITVVNGRYLEAANLAGEGRVLLGGQPMNRARLRADDELGLGPVTLRLSYVKTEAPEPSLAMTDGSSGSDQADAEEDEDETVAGAPRPTDAPSTVDAPRPPAVGSAGIDPESDTSSRLSTLGEMLVPPGTSTKEGLPALATMDGTNTESGPLAVDLDESELDPAPVVIIEPPGGRGQEVPLKVGSFVVGAGRCAFRLSYPGVAPAHTEIMVMPDGVVYVKHLAGSGLLTMRNGAPIQFARWTAGDRLQVGPVAMRLELISRDKVESALHAPQVPGAHAGSSTAPILPAVTRHPPPPDIPPITADEVVEQAFSSTTTFSGRALPRSITEEGPAPLIRVRKAPPRKKRPAKQTNRPPKDGQGSVEVSLDVTSYETFQSFDDELSYRRPLARRLFVPGLIALLFLLIVGQYFYMQDRLSGDIVGSSSGPQTARGSSGLTGDRGEAAQVGAGSVQIGEIDRRGRGQKRAAGGSGKSGGLDIDWEDQRSGIRFEGPRRSSYSGAGELSARPADDIERTQAVAAPTKVSADQGFVDMKVVNGKIANAHRKFRYCYEQARQDDEALEGIMWLNMTLSSDGRIRGVVVEPRSTLKSEVMRRCMEKKLFSLKMPTPTGGAVTFSAPFQFDATGP
ncbi:MAG: hypothetical protein CMP23_07880 [Rickettsiales bacterium]|nr:hypothetical protein [Rickettsiales bacterium]